VRRARAIAAAAAMAFLGVVLCWRATVQPLVTDEVEFVQTGPALWRGEGPVACGGPQQEVILHHPQAYHLLLGAVAALRGGQLDPLAARLPGVVSLLLTLPLVLLLVRLLNPDGRSGWAAAALLATSPLAVQGALVVDIDSTILNPALMLFVWPGGAGCSWVSRSGGYCGSSSRRLSWPLPRSGWWRSSQHAGACSSTGW